MAEKIEGTIQPVRLLIRGGDEAEWRLNNENLLNGEIGYAFNNEDAPDNLILKIGDGQTPWASLSVDEEGTLEPTVFFSGRGAGIRAPVSSDDSTLPYGGVHIHAHTDQNKKTGLMVDKYGFITLWKNDEGLTDLSVDILTANKVNFNDLTHTVITDSDEIILRTTMKKIVDAEGNETWVEDPDAHKSAIEDNNLSGLRIRDYNGANSAILGVNNKGEWGFTTDELGYKGFKTFMTSPTFDGEGLLYWGANLETGEYDPHFYLKTLYNLAVQINQEDPQVYNPVTASLNTIQIPCVKTITVHTTEISPEESQEGATDFNVDANGKVTITLPITTGYSVDKWNNKIADVKLEGTTIVSEELDEKGDKIKVANIPVDLNSLWHNEKLTAPLQTITYNGKKLTPDSNFNITISPHKYVVKAPEYKEDPMVRINVKKDTTKELTTYTISGTHKQTIINATTEDASINEANAIILSTVYSHDAYGHVVDATGVRYSFEQLLKRISVLEEKVATLEAKNK